MRCCPWTVKEKKKLRRKHDFLQSSLITRLKAETFWQWRRNDSIAELSMRVLCNMLAIISSLCSPMFCQLVNLSWINWRVQNCVREADCCWNNLYFKCSFHIFCHFIFKWPHIKSRCYQHSYCIFCVSAWKEKYFPYHTSTEQIKIEKSLGSFTVGQSDDSNVCNRLNMWLKHNEPLYEKVLLY